MGLTFNPITGQFDIKGTSGGSPTVQNPNYQLIFNSTTDWGSPSGGIYTMSIPASTHGKGTKPIVQVLELNGGSFIMIGLASKMDASGNITLEVNQTPDNRFSGKIIIAENN